MRADCIDDSVLVHWTAASEIEKNMDTICESNEPLLTEILTQVPADLPSEAFLATCVSEFDTSQSNVFSKAKKKIQLKLWSKLEGEKLRALWSYVRLNKRKYGATKTRSALQNQLHVYDTLVSLNQQLGHHCVVESTTCALHHGFRQLE